MNPVSPQFRNNLSMILASAGMIIVRTNQEKGWYDSERTFGDLIALLHSELSEMLEAFRNGEEEHIAEEAADVLIRLLDLCNRYGIDLGLATASKMNKNMTREYRHGGKKL